MLVVASIIKRKTEKRN